MYAGKCFGEVAFEATPAMATLRPNVFPIVENAKAGAVEKYDPALDAGQLKTKVAEVAEKTERATSERLARREVTKGDIAAAHRIEIGAGRSAALGGLLQGAPAVRQSRTCADGVWAEWSLCAPECAPGATDSRPCAASEGAEGFARPGIR